MYHAPRKMHRHTLPIYEVRHYQTLPCSSSMHRHQPQVTEITEEKLRHQIPTRRQHSCQSQTVEINAQLQGTRHRQNGTARAEKMHETTFMFSPVRLLCPRHFLRLSSLQVDTKYLRKEATPHKHRCSTTSTHFPLFNLSGSWPAHCSPVMFIRTPWFWRRICVVPMVNLEKPQQRKEHLIGQASSLKALPPVGFPQNTRTYSLPQKNGSLSTSSMH